MKNVQIITKRIFFSLLSVLFAIVSFAQDKNVDVNISTNKGGSGGSFFSSPILWIVGLAVFILLLVALTRSRRA
jgi:uncharacterized membrane protein